MSEFHTVHKEHNVNRHTAHMQQHHHTIPD
jgi:hypothetical protein